MQAVVFVVDSAAEEPQMQIALDCLREVLYNQELSRKPCLFLANCQDKPNARNERQVI